MPNTSLYSSHQTKARAKPYALVRGPEALTNGIKWRQLTKNGLKTDREMAYSTQWKTTMCVIQSRIYVTLQNGPQKPKSYNVMI